MRREACANSAKFPESNRIARIPNAVTKLLCEARHLLDTRQCVVRVDEQDRVRVERGKLPKRIEFVCMRLHVTVRHGAPNRDAVAPAGKDVGGCRHARHVKSARASYSGVNAVGTARAKVHHGGPTGRVHHAGSFRCHEGLEVHLVDEQSLNELRLRQRRLNDNQWFQGEGHGAFRQRIDGSCKPKVRQEIQKVRGKAPQLCQKAKRLGRKAQILQIVQHVGDAACDEVIPSLRQTPHEEVKHCHVVHSPRGNRLAAW